ncbi:kelch-like protein 10 [Centruroides sculpturatus]|uniref:kelch-like protein 10 n=1 Tax=Centruroides sculpturatus TaxID=218467 RepID=UPI000C6DEFE7|nr:kelch-like protein 10 [Centruroides sculpturatus]
MEVKQTLSSHSLQVLNRIRHKGLLCDAVLNTDDGGQFQIHKCIMAAYSDYFEILFTFTIYGKDKHSFLMYDVNKDILERIIEYIYEGHIKLEWDNAREVFTAAEQYLMEGLVLDCLIFFELELNIQNCLIIREFTKTYQYPKFEELIEDYLLKNFVDIATKTAQIMDLTFFEN